jgi:pimeloyl-ACP methyl ester carboxylesterase
MNNYGVRRKSIQINNLATSFLDKGQGETIVALHGIPTSSLLFSPLFPLFSHNRIIAPDLLGQGQTNAPSTGLLDYAAYAAHLREFLNIVPPQHFHFLVHDLGGVLGLDWATENVERIDSLIILSTTITGSLWVGKLLYVANLVFGQSLLRWGMQSTLKRPQELNATIIDEWVRPWSRHRILRGMDHFARHHLQRIRSKLSRLRVPTLVIWGRDDNVFPLHHATSITQAFPHAKFYVIPECGHWSPIDAPEGIAKCILEFLRTNDSA